MVLSSFNVSHNHIYIFQGLELLSHVDLLVQQQLSDTKEPEEESVALSMRLTDTNTDPSRPALLAKDTQGAVASKAEALKLAVIFIS